MIFGNWRPGGLLAGSALFGYVDGVQLRAGGEAVHALLYAATILLRSAWRCCGRRGGTGGRPRSPLAPALVVYVVYWSIDDGAARVRGRTRRSWSRCWCWRWPRSGCGHRRRTGWSTGGARVTEVRDWDRRCARPRSRRPRPAYAPYSRPAGRRGGAVRRRPGGHRLQRGERLLRARAVRGVHDGRAAAADRRRPVRRGGLPVRARASC